MRQSKNCQACEIYGPFPVDPPLKLIGCIFTETHGSYFYIMIYCVMERGPQRGRAEYTRWREGGTNGKDPIYVWKISLQDPVDLFNNCTPFVPGRKLPWLKSSHLL